MGRVQFQLAYDGRDLRAGSMDVYELAPALLAAADLIRETNRQLNGEKADVAIRVRSDFKKGSFEVALVLNQTLIEYAKGLLFPATVSSASALVAVLFGTEAGQKGISGVVTSVLDLWKRLKGEKVQSIIEDQSKNLSIVVIGDNNQIQVVSSVARLYNVDGIRASIGDTLRPVGMPGIKSLAFKKGNKLINEVLKADMPSLDETVPLTNRTPLDTLENTREALLRLTRLNFEKGKWGFSDGSASFNAEIEDGIFIGKLNARQVGFYKGDVLRVLLKTVQIIVPDQAIQTRYTIVRVIQHLHSLHQPELPGARELAELPPPE